MKKILTLFAVAGVLCAWPVVSHAGEGHEHKGEHASEHAGGPKGGRLLENIEPHAEFFVEKDKTATITFYDEAMKPVPAAGQSAVLNVDTDGNKARLEFEKKGDVLVTKGSLPEGDSHNVVLQLKQSDDAKPANFRFAVDNNMCGECKRAEYACICEH